jgi:pyrimidine deaminase RibD-like protein
MRLAVSLAWQCPPSRTAFSVGAVVVGADGVELSRGFSREGGDLAVHAEEATLGKVSAHGARLAGATIYSTLEPCSQRKSSPRTCTELIIAAGLRRVVIAWREPALFVADCQGAELLARAGVEVTELPEFTADAAAPNRHLFPRAPQAPEPRVLTWSLFGRLGHFLGDAPEAPATRR